MAAREAINPPGMFANSPILSAGIKMGQFVFLSGHVASDEHGNVVGIGNTAEQAEFIMQRIQEVLEAAGASLKDVVTTTTFFTPRADIAAYNSVRTRYYPQDPPASATVIVNALLNPEWLLEIQLVAVIPDNS